MIRELQLGNNIYFNDVFSVVVKIDREFVGVENNHHVDIVLGDDDDIRGIPIDEHGLDVLGFRDLEIEWSKPIIVKDMFLSLRQFGEEWHPVLDFDGKNVIYLQKIQYLHQLQNLLNVLCQENHSIV